MPYRAVFARQSVIYAHPPRAYQRERAILHGGRHEQKQPPCHPTTTYLPTFNKP